VGNYRGEYPLLRLLLTYLLASLQILSQDNQIKGIAKELN